MTRSICTLGIPTDRPRRSTWRGRAEIDSNTSDSTQLAPDARDCGLLKRIIDVGWLRVLMDAGRAVRSDQRLWHIRCS